MANKYGETPLHYTAKNGKLETLKYLVERGADINMADKSGDKAQHFAAENNDIGMIEYIVLKGTYYRLLNKVKWVMFFA